jgi:chromosome segregation ATPase
MAELKAVAGLQGRLHTIKEAYVKTRQTLEVTDVELARQNTEYTSVLGHLSEEREKHKFRLDEMRETFTCRLQDAEQRVRQAKRLAKDAHEELDAFKMTIEAHRDSLETASSMNGNARKRAREVSRPKLN